MRNGPLQGLGQGQGQPILGEEGNYYRKGGRKWVQVGLGIYQVENPY